MNVQLITSSYPPAPDDPAGTAGLFVRDFALKLLSLGHRVVVQPVARWPHYQADPGLGLEPLPWAGGEMELASLRATHPHHWYWAASFFWNARKSALRVHRQYQVDRTLCLWAIPSGELGAYLRAKTGNPYDVWALGSDIWRIRRLPVIGQPWLRRVFGSASGIFADGMQLARDVETITGRQCGFLPSCRRLPQTTSPIRSKSNGSRRFLYVGRYHPNKGPDILLEAARLIPRPLRQRMQITLRGWGPLEAELRQAVTEKNLEDCVTVGPAIEARELATVLAQSDYLVIPSRIESIPVIFSDALQMGTPVLSTPVGDLPDLINRHRCGLTSTETNALSLSHVLQQAIEQEPQIFFDGVAEAAKQFSISQSVESWLSQSDESAHP